MTWYTDTTELPKGPIPWECDYSPILVLINGEFDIIYWVAEYDANRNDTGNGQWESHNAFQRERNPVNPGIDLSKISQWTPITFDEFKE